MQEVIGSTPISSTKFTSTGKSLLHGSSWPGTVQSLSVMCFNLRMSQTSWGYSSVGRAGALQASGRRFDPV